MLENASPVDLGGGFLVLAMAAPAADPGPGGPFAFLAQNGISTAVYLLSRPAREGMYGHLGGLDRLYRAHGIDPLWVETEDLGAPVGIAPMRAAVERVLARPPRTTVVHCRAGVGRTGLALCCLMVARGASPAQAVESLMRQRYPLQSEEQGRYLEAFARSLAGDQ